MGSGHSILKRAGPARPGLRVKQPWEFKGFTLKLAGIFDILYLNWYAFTQELKTLGGMPI